MADIEVGHTHINLCTPKGFAKLSLCLTKHHAIKTYWKVEV